MTEQPTRPFFTERGFRANTYDIDFAGIVSNIVYIRWLEDLRLALLEKSWPLEDQLREGYTAVLLTTEIQYVRAVRLLERPVGTIWVSSVGAARFTLQEEFWLDGRMTTRAEQTVAFLHTHTFRPARIPATFRQKYERELRGGGVPP